MKQKIFFLMSLLLFIFSIPLFTCLQNTQTLNLLKNNSLLTKVSAEQQTKNNINEPYFRVFDKSSGQVIPLSIKDFTYGAVATEMPLTFEPEALKAQAVASFTYFNNLKETNLQNPDPNLNGADFSVDSANWLYFVSKEQMQSRWGENFNFYYDKLSQALDPILGQTLKKDGKFIKALYHSISSGNTEAIVDVFGGNLSYLKAVPSPGDTLAPGFKTTKEFSIEEFKNLSKNKWPDISFNDNNLLNINKRTDSGMVLEANVGSIATSGREIREVFSLRSANFDVNIDSDKIIFSVKGYGHGVGMSQYGAQNMALQGATYNQILAWYYPDTEISPL